MPDSSWGSVDAALDLLDPTITKALWAALLSMVHDNHTAQDNLSDSEWALADHLYEVVYARVENQQ